MWKDPGTIEELQAHANQQLKKAGGIPQLIDSVQKGKDDGDGGMALVTLTDRPEDKAVEARVPLVATRTARYRPGWGCLLDPVP